MYSTLVAPSYLEQICMRLHLLHYICCRRGELEVSLDCILLSLCKHLKIAFALRILSVKCGPALGVLFLRPYLSASLCHI
jgi:hypothetical protein